MNLRDITPLGYLPMRWRIAVTGTLIVGLIVWFALGLPGASAQTLGWQAGYITEHPGDPDVAIVNVATGQYEVRPEGNCLGIAYDTNLQLGQFWPDRPDNPFVVEGRY